VGLLSQQVDLQWRMIEELGRLGGLAKFGDLHTEQIAMLAAITIYLGTALKNTQALTPEWAVTVRDLVCDQLEPDANDSAKAMVKSLDL
jgi:hypothetical protein